MVLLAENARIPIDNPATHLELTMIHEAMVLEYSARHLALIEWASSLKLFNYACIGFALFLPWGIAIHGADGGWRAAACRRCADWQSWLVAGAALGADRIALRQAAHLPRSGVSGHGVPARRAWPARSPSAGSERPCLNPISIAQLLNLLAAGLLLISFAMLSRRRTQRLITLFAWQGAILFLSTCLVAYELRP